MLQRLCQLIGRLSTMLSDLHVSYYQIERILYGDIIVMLTVGLR
jgi:hypothetical protein